MLAAVDAGRGEYYVGEYRSGENLGEVLLSAEETVDVARQPGAGVLVCDESRAEDPSPGNNRLLRARHLWPGLRAASRCG